jgi:hypothetical protein
MSKPREINPAFRLGLQHRAPSAIIQRAALSPESIRPAEIMRLQQTLGNRAVGTLLNRPVSSRPVIQAKLTVNAPGDEYEQEADRVAEAVMRRPAVQRAELEDEDEEPEIMTKREPAHAAGGAFEAGEEFEQQLRATHGQGEPLPTGLRREFEAKFGVDFSGVRVHTDSQSAEMNRTIQARAFTHGRDIYLGAGQYASGSDSGKRLLAHELTHVVQQSSGTHASNVIQRDVGFEFETDWGIHGLANPKKKAKGKKALKKHTSYKDFGGFQLQVDESTREINPGFEGIAYEIEFVVKHHSETKEGGRKLYDTMKELIGEAAKLETKAKAARNSGKGFHYPDVGNLWVFPAAKDTAKPNIHARPQATVGLSLAAINKYGRKSEAELSEPRRETGPKYSYVRRSEAIRGTEKSNFEHIARVAHKIPGASKDLAGLVTLMAFYIRSFNEPNAPQRDYAKAWIPMLAKTNFATMFEHLPSKEQKRYRADPSAFANLVLDTVNEIMLPKYKLSKEQPVIPEGKVSKKSKVDLTLENWLTSIPNGEDYLTKKRYTALFGFGDLEEGTKVDEIHPGEFVKGMILEFRSGVSTVGGFLKPSEWLDFAFDYYHLVRQLHGSTDTPLWPEHRRSS